jgi:hypothetical protein
MYLINSDIRNILCSRQLPGCKIAFDLRLKSVTAYDGLCRNPSLSLSEDKLDNLLNYVYIKIYNIFLPAIFIN